MGNPVSKNIKENDPSDGDMPSTPTLTARLRMVELDPRSPSTNVVRTPIQSTVKNNPETPIIGVINIPCDDDEQENDLVNIDPRSPTVEFTRTPITIGSTITRVRNKKLDMLRESMSLNSVKYSSLNENIEGHEKIKTDQNNSEIETDVIRKPKLLAVTPITKKTGIVEIRKHSIGLLETNLDDIETSFDTLEMASKNLDFLPVPESELKLKNEETIVEENLAHTVTNENPTKDFDKKVSSLIYEDQKMTNIYPILAKSTNARTVLSERNIIESTRLEAISKLKVNDKPTLTKQSKVSKIPVYRSKKLKQCENTPPKNMNTIKKRSEWDGDSTLII